MAISVFTYTDQSVTAKGPNAVVHNVGKLWKYPCFELITISPV